MKHLGLIFFALILFSTSCCLFDGDDDNGDTPELPPPAPPHITGQRVTLSQGTASILQDRVGMSVTTFSVGTEGTLRVRITWSAGPNHLDANLHHLATHTIDGVVNTASPIEFTMAVTKNLVDAGEEWQLNIRNDTGPDVEVSYKVTFTAD